MARYLATLMRRYGVDPLKLQHGIKWLIYLLLCLNLGGYIIEDWHAMLYGMPENPTKGERFRIPHSAIHTLQSTV